MNIKPIHVFAKWQVRQGQIELVLALLEEVVKKSTEEAGNLFYKIHQSNTDPNVIVLYEGYKDEQALQAHRDSEHFRSVVVGKIIPLLENREVMLTTPLSE